MVNYIGNLLEELDGPNNPDEPGWAGDNTVSEPPDDLPEEPIDFWEAGLLDVDFGEADANPPDLDPFPAYLAGLSDDVWAVPYGIEPPELGPELPLDEPELPAAIPDLAPPDETPAIAALDPMNLAEGAPPLDGAAVEGPDVPAAAGRNLWDSYVAAVSAGTNLGGGADALIARADEMNLWDARFMGHSDELGHHVQAIEIALDPATGQPYGQVLNVATFANPEQAGALYEELQGQVAENNLPNYAALDYAVFAADALGNSPELRAATEQDLALYEQHQTLEAAPDEPPLDLIDTINQVYAGLDPAIFQQESTLDYDRDGFQDLDREPLDYGIRTGQDEQGRSMIELVKEWDGGLRSGGGEDARLIGVYENSQEAQAVAEDLWNVQQDVQALTGSAMGGWQAMGSLAYEIGQANGTLQAGEPLFVNLDGPADPFAVVPTQELFAQYEAMQQEQTVEFDPGVHAPVYQEMDL